MGGHHLERVYDHCLTVWGTSLLGLLYLYVFMVVDITTKNSCWHVDGFCTSQATFWMTFHAKYWITRLLDDIS